MWQLRAQRTLNVTDSFLQRAEMQRQLPALSWIKCVGSGLYEPKDEF